MGRADANRGDAQRAAVGCVGLDPAAPDPDHDDGRPVAGSGDTAGLPGRGLDRDLPAAADQGHRVRVLVAHEDDGPAAAASCGCRPTRVSATTAPLGRATWNSRPTCSAGTRTGPAGPASCRCRGAPGSRTTVRTRPVTALTSATPSGLRRPTTRRASRSSTASPSGAPGIGRTVPAGACANGGALAGSGTSVRTGAAAGSPGGTPRPEPETPAETLAETLPVPGALRAPAEAPAGTPLLRAVPHPVPPTATARVSEIGSTRRKKSTRRIVGGPWRGNPPGQETVRNRLSRLS